MKVASLELSKELWELSGWDPDPTDWWPEPTHLKKWICPKYDLGYLLRKLEPVIQDPEDKSFKHIQLWINGDHTVHVAYVEPYDKEFRGAYSQSDDTPENAACKLAIALFKQGILKREGGHQ